MLSRLLLSPRYFHLKLIHTNPTGINDRYKHDADKWVANLRHPHIHTYNQYIYNMESHQYEIHFKPTEKQQSYIKKVQHSYKPGLAIMTDELKHVKPERPDDRDLDRDVSDMTFKKFIQEGRQNFTSVHKLAAHMIGAAVLGVILYFTFVYNRQLPKNDRVKMLNTEFIENYHFDIESSLLKQVVERIQIVNGEYLKRLKQAKQAKQVKQSNQTK